MLRDVVLLTKSSKKSNDPLNHTPTYSEQILNHVRITELNGAEAQNNAIGHQYNHTYVIRLEGQFKADKVAFLENYQQNKSNVMEISQTRHHHFKTDIYCGDTRVNS